MPCVQVRSYGGTLTYTFTYHINESVSSEEPYLANPEIIIEVYIYLFDVHGIYNLECCVNIG